MNARQVEAFRAVMEAGSITRAGKLLFISQPAVSRLISDLEEDIGFKLFQRHKGRLDPTVEGKLFYGAVEKVFTGLRELRETATAIKSLKTGLLRIIAMPGIATMLLPPILTRFCKQYPNINIVVENRPRIQLMDWLDSQHYDLGIANLPVDANDVVVHSSIPMDMMCAMPVHHRLARKQLIKVSDFDDENFISYSRNTYVSLLISQLFEQAGISPRLRMETRNTDEIIRLVAEGLGIAIVLPLHQYVELGVNLVFKDMENPIETELGLLIPGKREPSMAATRFIEVYSDFMQGGRNKSNV